MPEPPPRSLAELNGRIVACNRCPRLRQHCTGVASIKRRAYAEWEYWGLPVPSFGDVEAKVMILGLAPGAHGSNRTGRPFTGDGSGNFLYPVLYECGYASQPNSTSRDDGMRLKDLWISAAVRCAPPDNKPRPDEIANCAPYLDQEIALLRKLRVVVCLGKIAFDAYLSHLLHNGEIARRSEMTFAHAAEYLGPGRIWVLASYHPSLQNTNTGRLTHPMFKAIFERTRELAQQ